MAETWEPPPRSEEAAAQDGLRAGFKTSNSTNACTYLIYRFQKHKPLLVTLKSQVAEVLKPTLRERGKDVSGLTAGSGTNLVSEYDLDAPVVLVQK